MSGERPSAVRESNRCFVSIARWRQWKESIRQIKRTRGKRNDDLHSLKAASAVQSDPLRRRRRSA